MRPYRQSLLALLGAAALAAGLVLYAYFGVFRSEEKASAAREASEKLVAPVPQPDGSTALVRYDRLLVIARGESTELGRLADGAWVIFQPLRTKGDTRAAEDIVSALQSVRLNRIVEENPTEAALTLYGLSPPRTTVTARAEGAPTLEVATGIENPFDGSVYLRRAGDPRVYAVDGATRSALEKSTAELRNHELLGVRDLGLLGIEAKSAKHAWALAREPERPWAFLHPKGVPGDGAAISQWVSSLSQQRAERFLIDTPAERSRTGVETPVVDVTFHRKDETVRVRLAAGKKDTDPVYVLREDGSGATLAEVPRTALAALDRAPGELRDRRVLGFEPAQVDRIRFQPEGGGAPFVVERERADGGAGERWQLVSPGPGPASMAKVGTLLYGLSSLRSLPIEGPWRRDPGLGPRSRTVVLENGAGKVLATLVLGRPVPKKEKTVYARSAQGEVVEVDLGRLSTLPARPEDLLEQPPGLPPARADAGAGAP